MPYIILFFILLLTSSFKYNVSDTSVNNFNQYWKKGSAEITNYSLEENKYGQINRGEASIIFNAEYTGNNQDSIPSFIKLNLEKKYFVGKQTTTNLLSVHTPVNSALNTSTKVTCSSLEWCGNSFKQLTLNKNYYDAFIHYFYDKEGEDHQQLSVTLLEDELWNRIRINPENLPVGSLKIIPGLLSQKNRELNITSTNVFIEKVNNCNKPSWLLADDEKVTLYKINYLETSKTMEIYFQTHFSHQILGWQEQSIEHVGNKNRETLTRASKKNTLLVSSKQ